MSHEINLVGLGHAVHYQNEDYNLSVAPGQSTLQKVFTFYFYFPMALLGFPTEWFILISAYNLLYQFWIHTGVIDNMGWFGNVFNTPSHLRVHHGRNPKYIDKNHAGTLIIWDRMLGTFQKKEKTPAHGITNLANTFNPAKANVHTFCALWKELKKLQGWKNKLRLVFMPPGWRPYEEGGTQMPAGLTGKGEKYEASLPPALNYYLFVHYLLILGGAAVFLFNLLRLGWAAVGVTSLVIIYSIMALGLAHEYYNRTLISKGIWFLITKALLAGITSDPALLIPALTAAVVTGIVSTGLLHRTKQKTTLSATP